MKRYLLIIILSILSINYSHANIGYIESLAQDLSTTQSFIVDDSSVDDNGNTYYKMSSPKYYDCDLAVSMLSLQMSHYTNAKMVEAWRRSDGNRLKAAYRVGTSCILFILIPKEDNNGVTLGISEVENFFKIKSKTVRKPNKKNARRRR